MMKKLVLSMILTAFGLTAWAEDGSRLWLRYDGQRQAEVSGPECLAAQELRSCYQGGKVRLVINGHHHCDYLRILENVVYFDLNSASFYWMGSKYSHQNYPDSFFDANGQTPCKVSWLSWDDPLNAIVTLTADGGIRIDGMKSKFTCGVTPGMCGGFRLDPCSRIVVPDVQSANLRLSYSTKS